MPFQIIRNDITKVHADAIVNTANPNPIYAAGTDTAVYKAAGEELLLEARKKIGVIEPGGAAFTPAFNLPADYIIHTVGPVWKDGMQQEREILRRCYENSLRLAEELQCESIAFPLISTGSYGFPKAEALQIAVSAFSEFLKTSDMKILLVVFDETSFAVSGKLFADIDSYIDSHYVEEQMAAEYGAVPREDGRTYCRRCGRETDGFGLFCSYCGTPIERAEEDRISYSAAPDYYEEEAPLPKAAYKRKVGFSGWSRRKEKKKETSLQSLEARIRHLGETWQESLFRLIDEKGCTDTEVYKRANIDRKLFSKIRSNASYQPKKMTAVAFALALELNLDEAKDFLSRAGYAFSPSSKSDLIIEYFIEHNVYDVYTINLALFEHRQPLIGE